MTTHHHLNKHTLGKLLLIALLMFGFGYALVPIYYKICAVTGINVLTKKEDIVGVPVNQKIDKTRKMTIEFDANAHGPIRFRPTVNRLEVHPGEVMQTIYEVVNTQNRPLHVQAIPSYAPAQAARFFKKIECFCFVEQILAPNEARQMPVVFYIDPSVSKELQTMTLSYTFFDVGLQGVRK